MEPTYRIVRFYFGRDSRTIKRGLTLEQAQAHCADPQTSSSTCTTRHGRNRSRRYGRWFDGYSSEAKKG